MTSLKEHIQGVVTFKTFHDGKKEIDIIPVGNTFSHYREGYIHHVDADGKTGFLEIPTKDGFLIYTTSTGLDIKVPISDIGEATFLNQDKGILFMRYIRKSI